jgi:hypothetical protein
MIQKGDHPGLLSGSIENRRTVAGGADVEAQIRDIRKHFGPVKANDGITFRAGRRHPGHPRRERGRQSTLMKILSASSRRTTAT